jgi:hypothetical protein
MTTHSGQATDALWLDWYARAMQAIVASAGSALKYIPANKYAPLAEDNPPSIETTTYPVALAQAAMDIADAMLERYERRLNARS